MFINAVWNLRGVGRNSVITLLKVITLYVLRVIHFLGVRFMNLIFYSVHIIFLSIACIEVICFELLR
jgi:hypothetical protein